MRRELPAWIGAAAVLGVAIGIAGCAVTREPERKPDLPLPDALPAVTETATGLADPWWTIFDDPTLDALVEEALANNADAALAAARVAEARALARIAGADRLPTLGVEAGASRGRDSELTQPVLPSGGAIQETYFARGVVSYEADLWGRYAHASAAARNRLLAAEYDRDTFRLSLSGETARAYFALAAAIGQYQQSRDTLTNREESLRIEKLRFDAGESEEITYRRVEAEVETARAAMYTFELEVERRQNVLGLLLGRSPQDLVDQEILPQTLASSAAVARLPAGVPSSVLTQRPDVRAAEARLAAAAGDVGAARAALLPSISLTGVLGSASLDLDDLFTSPANVWSVAGGLTQPIFQGGRLRANVARERAVQDQRIAEYARTVQGAFREVLDGLQGQSSLRNVEAARVAQVTALRRATDLAELKYKEGEIAYLELLDVRRSLFAAEIELLAARREALTGTVDLALALGGGPTVP
jgi:multidrug efflux system outer membrane protein